MKKLLTAVLLVGTLSFGGFASTTLNGPTGLIEVPSAEVLGYKSYNLGLDFTARPNTTGLIAYKANLGTFKGWEIGIVGGTVPTEGVYVNGKYFLMQESLDSPASIAIGVEKLASPEPSLYLVVSKKIAKGLNGTFGFQSIFRRSIDVGVMLGAEYFVDNTFSVVSDLIGDNSRYRLNAGVRAHLSDEWQAQLSALDLTQSTNADVHYQIGLTFTTLIL